MNQVADPWNFEDAIRYVMARTGLEEGPVRAVLAAKEAYLDLAGIGQVEESDALIQEREVYRHLLPDRPNELDHREFEYVLAKTGLNEEILETVYVGEMAYSDRLGIIEWPDEAERAGSLGRLASLHVSDSDRGLEAIQHLFEQNRVKAEQVAEDSEGVVLVFHLAEDRYAIHLRVTRWPRDQREVGPAPKLLEEVCTERDTRPLQVRVNLYETLGGVYYDYFGLEAFTQEMHSSLARWRRHLLMGLDVEEWLARAGSVSTFGIDMKDGHPRVKINGQLLALPLEGGGLKESPLVDPIELCRSVSTDDECWIFTCGCGEPGCAGIWSGILVVHTDPYVVWLSPEHPDVPLGVFPRWRYCRTILAVTRVILRASQGREARCGVYGIGRRELKQALHRAHHGVPWLRGGRMILHAPE